MASGSALEETMIERTARLFPGRLAPAPGRIYAWGKVGGKGGNALPVAPSEVDRDGDCVFPARCTSDAIFLKTSVDVGPFCALDVMGRVWAWHGWGQTDRWPTAPKPVLDGCMDCAAGGGFIVAAKADGSVWMLGKAPSPTPLPDARGGWTRLASRCDAAAFVAVDACEGVVMAATAEGLLFSCGRGAALGLDAETSSAGTAALTAVPEVPPVCSFSAGSLHGACAGRDDGSVWVWGDGLSGNHGLGQRRNAQVPTRVPALLGAKRLKAKAGTEAEAGAGAEAEGSRVGVGERAVHVSCTRGQPRPKRVGSRHASFASGQEGPRCHVVTAEGGLWVAGACHKGLGGDHVGKTLGTSGSDHTSFYRVGGAAQAADTQQAVLTGAAEEWPRDRALAAWRMGMADADAFGAHGATGYLSGVRVVSSCPSHIHSLALADDGRAFAWGCGSDGRTGLAALLRGPGGSKRRLKCYVSTPSAIEALEAGHRVLQLTSGRYWSLAVVAPRDGGLTANTAPRGRRSG